ADRGQGQGRDADLPGDRPPGGHRQCCLTSDQPAERRLGPQLATRAGKVPATMWSEIVAIYRASKKRRDINWFTEWVARPPGAVVVYALRGTPITPNQVTFVSAVIAAGACAMFALLPGHAWLIAAAAVFELSFVLDCADGQLARLRRTASPLGHLLDFLMDELKAMLLLACVAVRLWTERGDERFLLIALGR